MNQIRNHKINRFGICTGFCLTFLLMSGCESPRMSANTAAISDASPAPSTPRFLQYPQGPEAAIRALVPMGTTVSRARLILSDEGLSTTARYSESGDIAALVATYEQKRGRRVEVTHVFTFGLQSNKIAGIAYAAQGAQQ